MMTKKEVEDMIFAIDENTTKAMQEANARWMERAKEDPRHSGGCFLIPDDEMERRKAYQKMMAKIFREQGISENSFPEDNWLSGKIKRLLRHFPGEEA